MTTSIEAFRRVDGNLIPLVLGASGYVCSEGNVIVLETVSDDIPVVTVCGETLQSRTLRRFGDVCEASFERLIDVWAGRATFVLQDGAAQAQIQLDVGPHAGKLDPTSWDALITELSTISTSLPWGLAPGQAAGTVHADAPAVVHPAIIESQLPLFRRLMARLLADPPTRTLRTRTLRPLDLSRRADLVTMRWLGRRPLELAGLRGMAGEDHVPNSRVLVDQPQTTISFDHSITRYVAWLLDRIRKRLVATAAALRGPAGRRFPDLVADTYARQLADQVDAAVIEIDILRRAPLFRAITPAPPDDSALQALIDDPLYTALHRIGRRLADPGLAFAPGQDLYSSLKHSYDLFELLVLYRLADAISGGLSADWSLKRCAKLKRLPREDRPPDGAVWVWRGPDGQTLEFRYQPAFAAAKAPPDLRRFSSLSAFRIPDYALILWRGSEVVSWILLDAKYRSGRTAIHEGLGDMHRYRDALRVRGQPAAAAFIVVPRLQDSAALYASPGYTDAYDLGAMPLYDEGWTKPIWRWLGRFGVGAEQVAS